MIELQAIFSPNTASIKPTVQSPFISPIGEGKIQSASAARVAAIEKNRLKRSNGIKVFTMLIRFNPTFLAFDCTGIFPFWLYDWKQRNENKDETAESKMMIYQTFPRVCQDVADSETLHACDRFDRSPTLPAPSWWTLYPSLGMQPQ